MELKTPFFMRTLAGGLLLFFSLWLPAQAGEARAERLSRRIGKQPVGWVNPLKGWDHLGKITLDSVAVQEPRKRIEFFFSRPLSYMPVRESDIGVLRESVAALLGRRFRNWELILFSDGRRLETLVPNLFRRSLIPDEGRFRLPREEVRIPLLRRMDGPVPENGLFGSHIALWSSHGWYYEATYDRWEWQRARLFSTVEDIYTKSIVIPYLVPMLENSGATVLLPVERDWQPLEVIVDNDRSSPGSFCLLPRDAGPAGRGAGFLAKDTLFPGENPFVLGTSLDYETAADGEAVYLPRLEEGTYAVSVSYRSHENSCREVLCTVRDGGGEHRFRVNQRMGGGTWVFLGTFRFPGGDKPDPLRQSVTISLRGQPGELISLDAVRFGGGMGNVARRPSAPLVVSDSLSAGHAPSVSQRPEEYSWKTSGKPRYREAARYYLQYAGFPDTLVFSLNGGRNDYNDDYQSRGEWVNYLMGAPCGPQKNRQAPGLHIPVDLSLAFHTDAGITRGDTIVGTLGIYSTLADSGRFPDGTSRMASRDLTDLVQTQIVADIRALYHPRWTRRGLWDRPYSEAWRPNAPAMLLELLSHQNLADMRLGLDPRFRFTAARSIYKGMLRFQAARENRNPVVHPLPVDQFGLRLEGDSLLLLTWRPVDDPLEPTAVAESYKVYRQLNRSGWDEGTLVSEPFCRLPAAASGELLEVRVTALNGGGESFPSETLTAGVAAQPRGTVLIVNAFDRICGPAMFDSPERGGIEWWRDEGVAWHANDAYTGNQYDYDRRSAWTDDDNPGWGSSHADGENRRIPGNSFDFSALHAAAFLRAGYNVVTVSDELFESARFDPSEYFLVDLLLGEEKSTSPPAGGKLSEFRIYTPELIGKLTQIAGRGGNLLLSGAYAGTDLTLQEDSSAARFARDVLCFTFRTGHGCTTGRFYGTDRAKPWFDFRGGFNAGSDSAIYAAEAPDGIEPCGEGFTCFRYTDNNVSAGVAYRGSHRSLVFGFPLETVLPADGLCNLVTQIVRFFEKP